MTSTTRRSPEIHEKWFVAKYSSRDLILYALGVGCHDLKYIYERDKNFRAFPTFPLALSFTASGVTPAVLDANSRICKKDSNDDDDENKDLKQRLPPPRNSKQNEGSMPEICPFPPPTMASPIPKSLCKNSTSFDYNSLRNFPILHISQKFQLHRAIPIPYDNSSNTDSTISLHLRSRLVSVLPKSIGTFVVTETDYFIVDKKILNESSMAIRKGKLIKISSSQTTFLIMNAPKQHIQQYLSNVKSAISLPISEQRYSKNITRMKTKPDYTATQNVSPHQAFLYRLSGDYNPIHVDATKLPKMTKSLSPKPILHGLCTLGYGVHTIFNYFASIHMNDKNDKEEDFELTHVECDFTGPLFVGDNLSVKIWKETEVKLIHDEKEKSESKPASTFLKYFYFQVLSSDSGRIVLDKGLIEITKFKSNTKDNKKYSKL